jgi:hypothetical protein
MALIGSFSMHHPAMSKQHTDNQNTKSPHWQSPLPTRRRPAVWVRLWLMQRPYLYEFPRARWRAKQSRRSRSFTNMACAAAQAGDQGACGNYRFLVSEPKQSQVEETSVQASTRATCPCRPPTAACAGPRRLKRGLMMLQLGCSGSPISRSPAEPYPTPLVGLDRRKAELFEQKLWQPQHRLRKHRNQQEHNDARGEEWHQLQN